MARHINLNGTLELLMQDGSDDESDIGFDNQEWDVEEN